MKLAKYVKEISDDFKGTFSVVSDNVLQNMIGHNGIEQDKKLLLSIVRKYIPEANLKYQKLGWVDGEYDCYIISLLEE